MLSKVKSFKKRDKSFKKRDKKFQKEKLKGLLKDLDKQI
jgi:hypothetical protein